LYNKFAISFVALLPMGLLTAQADPARPSKPTNPPAATAPAAGDQSQGQNQRSSAEGDAILATWLVVGNENEIALARLALQRAQSPEVKEFAQKLVTEHGQFVQKLQPFVGANRIGSGAGTGGRSVGESGGIGTNGRSDGNDRGNDKSGTADRSGTGQPADASGTRSNSPMGSLDHAALIRDLGRKCLESETQLLGEKSGAEFDRAFASMQVYAHVRSQDMLEVFGNYATDRLRPILAEGQRTVKSHLEAAKALCKATETVGVNSKDKGLNKGEDK